jgi:hypothetical protein
VDDHNVGPGHADPIPKRKARLDLAAKLVPLLSTAFGVVRLALQLALTGLNIAANSAY